MKVSVEHWLNGTDMVQQQDSQYIPSNRHFCSPQISHWLTWERT